MTLLDYQRLRTLALDEFPDIVAGAQIIEVNELRILLQDARQRRCRAS